MSKKSETQQPDAARDLEAIRELVTEGRLDATVQKLDAKDVKNTLRAVPVEVVRLLMAAAVHRHDWEDQLRVVKDDDRVVLKEIFRVSQKDQIVEFLKSLIDLVRKDSSVREYVGLRFTEWAITAEEREFLNYITHAKAGAVLSAPSRRVLVELGFYREDKLLLRSTLEYDDLLFLATQLFERLAESADDIREAVREGHAKIHTERCTDMLRAVRKNTSRIAAFVREYGQERLTDKKKKKKKKQSKQTTRRRPSAKRAE